MNLAPKNRNLHAVAFVIMICLHSGVLSIVSIAIVTIASVALTSPGIQPSILPPAAVPNASRHEPPGLDTRGPGGYQRPGQHRDHPRYHPDSRPDSSVPGLLRQSPSRPSSSSRRATSASGSVTSSSGTSRGGHRATSSRGDRPALHSSPDLARPGVDIQDWPALPHLRELPVCP